MRVSTTHPRVSTVVGNVVFFDWWVRLQERVERASTRSRAWLLGICITLGVAARLWAQTLPGNWDFGQWTNVSTTVLAGGDPYTEFGYNYPPPWLFTLVGFQAVTDTPTAFRLLISLLLIAADIGIVLLLVHRGYTLAACLFILSPITIAISGQHQQVEGIAVVLALAAMALLSGAARDRIDGREWTAALLLGLSLSFKPIFLLLPFWLLVQPGEWKVRLFRFFAPLAVFGIVFASAFLFYPPTTVIAKVLGHQGTNNSPLLNTFLPGQLAPWIIDAGGAKIAFVVLLAASAFLFRRQAPFELALLYSVSALVFAWAVANQYLATPMAAVAIYLNIAFAVWLGLCTIYLGGDAETLNLPVLNQIQPHILLEWNQVMQDLFPWLLAGWILLALALRQSRAMRPRQAPSRS